MSHNSDEDSARIIYVIGTGGTISCTHNSAGDVVPTLSIEQILEQAELSNLHPDIEFRAADAMSLDSSALQLADIDLLVATAEQHIAEAQREGRDLAGIIVVHGTDSLEETAMAFDQLLPGSVPVVLTGAQRPADDTNPDGPANLRLAVETIVSLPPLTPARPQIVFGGTALPAFGATKIHTSDDAGFTNTVESERALPFVLSPDARPSASPVRLEGLNVPIVDAYAGADGHLISTILSSSRPDGLVIAAMGSGNIPPAMVEALQGVDVPVVVCSRVPFGGVNFVYGGAGGGASLARAGMVSGGALRPSQARIALLCSLAREATAPAAPHR